MKTLLTDKERLYMKLKNLIECTGAISETEITGITCDSRQVKEGFAFVCIVGAKSDGHDYAPGYSSRT